MKDQTMISSKETLMHSLEKQKGLLSNSTISYLNSLLELDFSVMKKYITDEERTLLSEFSIYNNIAKYNIYNRAINLFKECETNLRIMDFDDEANNLEIFFKTSQGNVPVFSYYCIPSNKLRPFNGLRKSGELVPHNNSSVITFNQTIENIQQKEQEMIRILNKLDILYNKKNPHYQAPNVYGGPASLWALNHEEDIRKYERMFNQLDNKKELTDIEKQEIEITKYCSDKLLEDYGLSKKDFEEEKNVFGETSLLQKKLIKKLPNITIEDEIKYV